MFWYVLCNVLLCWRWGQRTETTMTDRENSAPRVGQTVDLGSRCGGLCRIIAVRPFGTIDVENIRTGRCYRVSGLMF